MDIDFILEDQHLDIIRERIDVAIRSGTLPDSSLMHQKLASLPRSVCASPDYFERYGILKSPQELVEYHCFHIKNCSGASMSWHFWNGKDIYRQNVSSNLSLNDVELVLEAAVKGMGIAHLPNWLAKSALQEGRLVPILEKAAIPAHLQGGIYAVRPPAPKMLSKMKVFLDELKKNVRFYE